MSNLFLFTFVMLIITFFIGFFVALIIKIIASWADLASFLNDRWKGMSPIAWGDTLRESEYTAWIYEGVCGLTSSSKK